MKIAVFKIFSFYMFNNIFCELKISLVCSKRVLLLTIRISCFYRLSNFCRISLLAIAHQFSLMLLDLNAQKTIFSFLTPSLYQIFIFQYSLIKHKDKSYWFQTSTTYSVWEGFTVGIKSWERLLVLPKNC